MDPSVPRKDLLRLAAAGLGAAAAGSLAAPRVARAVAPGPVGDDLGYVQFGVVAELVCETFYRRALGEGRGWTHGERRRLAIARDGVTNTADPGTRELLGLAADARHLAGLEELGRGTAASAGLQGVTFLENASAELDQYLSFPEGSR